VSAVAAGLLANASNLSNKKMRHLLIELVSYSFFEKQSYHTYIIYNFINIVLSQMKSEQSDQIYANRIENSKDQFKSI